MRTWCLLFYNESLWCVASDTVDIQTTGFGLAPFKYANDFSVTRCEAETGFFGLIQVDFKLEGCHRHDVNHSLIFQMGLNDVFLDDLNTFVADGIITVGFLRKNNFAVICFKVKLLSSFHLVHHKLRLLFTLLSWKLNLTYLYLFL